MFKSRAFNLFIKFSVEERDERFPWPESDTFYLQVGTAHELAHEHLSVIR